jgi:hypothetical protein
MCTLALNHFYNWLRFSKEYASENLINHTIPFKHESLPFFLLELKQRNRQDNNLSFWTFFTKNQTTLIRDIKCPFSTVKQRRNPRKNRCKLPI